MKLITLYRMQKPRGMMLVLDRLLLWSAAIVISLALSVVTAPSF